MEQVLGARAGVGDCWSFALRVHVGEGEPLLAECRSQVENANI